MGVRPSYFGMFNIRAQEIFFIKKISKFQKSNGQILKFKKRNGQKYENSIQLIAYQSDTLNEL